MEIERIRNDFPILKKQVYGKTLVYFDNAATTQKPQQVIDSIVCYYKELNSNIHRGAHYLSHKATIAFENARQNVQKFINAPNSYEINFTRGTTESINLVASTYGKKYVNEGDEVIVSRMEHHSNIVPWQMLCEEKKAKLKVIPFNEKGELDMQAFETLITERTKIISIAHVSNALGTINPVKKVIEKAHRHNIPVLIDGAQSVPHLKVDVQDLDCDFYCFSGHKIYGPMGIGVMFGKEKLLEEMPPYMGGGEMIKDVTFEKTTYNDLPFKFEAGTPNVADGIGLDVALQYVSKIGLEKIDAYEHKLLNYTTGKLLEIDGVRIIGTAENKSGVISFLLGNAHPYDVGTLLDKLGIAVRTGNHCAQPVMDFFNIPGTVRASFGIYNTIEEADIFIAALKKIQAMLS
ncbi:MAG: cysteine desulfurase [Bacteroidales bacterium]|nr:cysteine desulfurase [Bacteroidales bacterium]